MLDRSGPGGDSDASKLLPHLLQQGRYLVVLPSSRSIPIRSAQRAERRSPPEDFRLPDLDQLRISMHSLAQHLRHRGMGGFRRCGQPIRDGKVGDLQSLRTPASRYAAQPRNRSYRPVSSVPCPRTRPRTGAVVQRTKGAGETQRPRVSWRGFGSGSMYGKPGPSAGSLRWLRMATTDRSCCRRMYSRSGSTCPLGNLVRLLAAARCPDDGRRWHPGERHSSHADPRPATRAVQNRHFLGPGAR